MYLYFYNWAQIEPLVGSKRVGSKYGTVCNSFGSWLTDLFDPYWHRKNIVGQTHSSLTDDRCVGPKQSKSPNRFTSNHIARPGGWVSCLRFGPSVTRWGPLGPVNQRVRRVGPLGLLEWLALVSGPFCAHTYTIKRVELGLGTFLLARIIQDPIKKGPTW